MTLTDLMAALDGAPTDAQRKAVLSAAPWRVREELVEYLAAQAYDEMLAVPQGTLMEKMDTAPDDAARAALLRKATVKDRVQLSSDVRWRNASPDECASMYLAMIDPDAA